MEVEGLAGEQLADVTFTLHVGEILGLAGLKEAAIGELPLIVGEFDLSLGSMIGFLAMFGAYLGEEGFTAEIVIPGMLIAGALVGLINGLLTVKLHISSFIATLGTGILLSGVTLGISNGQVLF